MESKYHINCSRLNYFQEKKGRVKKKIIFPGATTQDMHDYIKPHSKKPPDNVTLHVVTNNTSRKSGKSVLEKILE